MTVKMTQQIQFIKIIPNLQPRNLIKQMPGKQFQPGFTGFLMSPCILFEPIPLFLLKTSGHANTLYRIHFARLRA